MLPWGLKQDLVHGWEFAFKLHRPHSLMHCTWRNTESAEMSSRAKTYYHCSSQTNKTQAQSKTLSIKVTVCFLAFFLFIFSYEAMLYELLQLTKKSHCSGILTINELGCVLSWSVEVWSVELYDMLGQRLGQRRTCHIPLRGVSLTFIDQTVLLTLPLPSFRVVEWLCRSKNAFTGLFAIIFCHLGTGTLKYFKVISQKL